MPPPYDCKVVFDLLPKIRARGYMIFVFAEGRSMTQRKYSEVEMIGALKQMEAGRSAAEVGPEPGVLSGQFWITIDEGNKQRMLGGKNNIERSISSTFHNRSLSFLVLPYYHFAGASYFVRGTFPL